MNLRIDIRQLFLLTLSLVVIARTTITSANDPERFVPIGNFAYQAKVTGSEFNSKGTETKGWFGGWNRNDLSDVTSGKIGDYWKGCTVNEGGPDGELAFLVFELSQTAEINTIKIWSKSGNTFLAQIVQVSENGEDWQNVYNSDSTNRAGQDPSDSGKTVCGGKLTNKQITGVKAGTDVPYLESNGKSITFASTKVRFVRWWCSGNQAHEHPMMIQLQAFKNCIVTFDYGEEKEIVKTSAPEMSYVSKPESRVSENLGQRFLKWTEDKVGGKDWDFSQPISRNTNLVANWETVAVHTVKFNSDGGNSIEPIQVTDGMTVTPPTPPTKDNCIFAGWKQDDEPFNFDLPVNSDIDLVATWVGLPTPNAVILHAGLLDLTLNSHGVITGLTSSLDAKDYYADGPDGKNRSLVSLVVNRRLETPTSVSFEPSVGELTFGFASINSKATVKVIDKGDYTSLTLTGLEKPSTITVQAVLWGPIKNSITTGGQTVGVAYNDEFAIGLHMLNVKTIGGWPIEFKNDFYASDLPLLNGYADPRALKDVYVNTAAFSTWGSALQAYSWDYTQPTVRTLISNSEVKQLYPPMTGEFASELASIIGSSIALYGTRSDNILNVISNIQINEGLPHPTIDGEWQKTSIMTGQDFLVYNDPIWDLSVVENDAKMANAAGINYIYGQYGAGGPWNGDGSFEFNELFGGSDENAKLLVSKASEYGVFVGTHTLSNLIAWDTKYMKPEASSVLSYAGFSNLTRPVKSTDTALFVEDGYPFSDEVVSASEGGRLLRIKGELITFTNCIKIGDHEYRLTECTRGVNGTTASDYDAQEKVYKLWQYYTCPALGGWESIIPVTTRMGKVYSELGMHSMSYDAFEATKFSIYSTMLPTMYMNSVYYNVKAAGKADGFLTETSDMYSNIWDVQSRISWGESNTPINLIMNNMSYYNQNFLPSMLGWMYDHGNHGGYTMPQFLMNLSMKGGWNAGAGWYVNRNTFNTYPYMSEMLRVWNNAIQRGAFIIGSEYTKDVQTAMKNAWSNNRIWTLSEDVENQAWTLQEVNKTNVEEKIGEPIHLFASHSIEVKQPENGDIATSASRNYSKAHEGDVITVYVQPFTGRSLVVDSLQALDSNGQKLQLQPVDGRDNTYTFIMPSSPVVITAEIAKDN